jgi:hypothetical protein
LLQLAAFEVLRNKVTAIPENLSFETRNKKQGDATHISAKRERCVSQSQRLRDNTMQVSEHLL